MARLFPNLRGVHICPFGIDADHGDDTEKGFGYGVPLRITVDLDNGDQRQVVLHTAGSNDFGHDRRSDRAQAMLLSYDTFPRIPRHVAALDVGAIDAGGELQSLRNSCEFYLVTSYAEGRVYAGDLRRVAREHRLGSRDRKKCTELARDLVTLHSQKVDKAGGYRRAIRDLVGHGEGIFGIVDGYPADMDGISPARLQRIESRCLDWRWTLRNYEHRLRVTHGDFHPFNIVFSDDGELALLDASRGCCGDPADDVCCLALNYVFFGLDDKEAWNGGLGALWRLFWNTYLEFSGDTELLSVAAPFLAWRGLVLANPRWYPAITPECREALIGYIEGVLDADTFSPSSAEALFS